MLQTSQDEMRKNLQSMSYDEVPSLRQLSWRFDLQIGSKMLNEEVKPKILYDFELKNASTVV